MTSHKIGVNLRVSGNCNQGGRKYMEDYHAIKFVKKNGGDYEYAYFGIFDGHGGPEASRFARENLLREITKHDQFWSDNDAEIKDAIKSGFLDTHNAMWKELEKWPRTVSGLPSTSGTTASVAIVKNGKLYIGHVGDSGIVLGCDEGPCNAIFIKPICLTKDHKPDNPEEKDRIERCGGSVVAKSGVQRVVWSRPKVSHKGPVRRSTQIDRIPFLAVARSLGDLWSYDYYKGIFVVSPEPDVTVMPLLPGRHRCLVLGSDGLWNMISPEEAVSIVTDLEVDFEERVIHDPSVTVSYWINPAEKLVTLALNKWRSKLVKADNISCVVVLIDPLGPSKLTVLRKRREEHFTKLKDVSEAAPAAASTQRHLSASTLMPLMATASFDVPRPAISRFSHNYNNVGEGVVTAENFTDGAASRDNAENDEDASGGTGNKRCMTGVRHPCVRSMHDSSCGPGRSLRRPSQSRHGKRHLTAPRTLSLQALRPVNAANRRDNAPTTFSMATSKLSFNGVTCDAMGCPVLTANRLVNSGEDLVACSRTSVSDSLLNTTSLDAVKASSGTLPLAKCDLCSHSASNPVGHDISNAPEHGFISQLHYRMMSSSKLPIRESLETSTSLDQVYIDKDSMNNRVTYSQSTHAGAHIIGMSLVDSKVTNQSEESFLCANPATARVVGPSFQNGPSNDEHCLNNTNTQCRSKASRESNLLRSTRKTFCLARNVARKVLRPENRRFGRWLPPPRRLTDVSAIDDTPSKRLRRGDELHRLF